MVNLGSNDIASTAGSIAALDLVITVDTMVAHLAGSLGKPVWLLLNYLPDWRWPLHGETTPWYPSMRLFRQEARNWEGPIRNVARALAAIA
jgi:ADP-heptose:LPS heptosyltransferase